MLGRGVVARCKEFFLSKPSTGAVNEQRNGFRFQFLVTSAQKG